MQQYQSITLIAYFEQFREKSLSKINEYFNKIHKIVEDFSQQLNESLIQQIRMIQNYENSIEKIMHQKMEQRDKIEQYLQYAELCINNNMEQLQSSLQFLKIDDYTAIVQKEMDILYLEQLNESQKQSQNELEELELSCKLSHQFIAYEESFNPQYSCITSCAINYQNEFITGGWDGKLIKFTLNEIITEIQLFDNPITIIKFLRNNCYFVVSSKNQYKILNKNLEIIRENVIEDCQIVNIDEYVYESHHVIKIRVDNGDQYIGNVKNAILNGLKLQKLQGEIQGKVVTNYFDDIIIVDPFDNYGSIVICSTDGQNNIISRNQFKICDEFIKKAVIVNEDQYYFMDNQNNIYLYDSKQELNCDDLMSFNNNLLFINEEIVKINSIEHQNKLLEITNIYSNDKYLILVGYGENQNVQIFKYK